MKPISRGKLLLLTGALCVIVASILSWASTFSDSYQVCQSERADSYADNKKSDLLDKVMSFFVCEGVTLDDNADLLTAVATIFIAAFTLTLWRATNEQGVLTRESIKEAKSSAEKQLRAYVGLKGSRFKYRVNIVGEGDQKTTKGYFLEVKITMKNFGQTPAKELVTWASGKLCVGDEQPKFVVSGTPGQPRSMAPKSRYIHKVTLTVTDEQMACLRQGTATFYIFGEVRYTDSFGTPQETDFRLFLGGPIGLTSGKRVAHCKEGNRAT